jgi:AraC-like DNA-binding protein
MTDVSKEELAHLGFRRIEPSEPLREFIECYWFIDATCAHTSGFRHFLHPDGAMGMIFNYGDALSFDNKQKQIHSYLDGTTTKSVELGLNGRINAVGIRFKPAGASVFFGLPLSELKNHQLDLADMKLHQLANLYDRLPSQTTLFEKTTVIEHALLKTRLQDKGISPQTHAAIEGITRSRGMLPISNLATQLDLGHRKLERLFKSQLGMSPVEFARTIRVEHARHQLKQTESDLADIAYQLGFYDQAHFIKTFKTVVGLTPGKYRKRSR